MAQFIYNNAPHSTTGKAPSEVLIGFRGDMRINIDIKPEQSALLVRERAEETKAIREVLSEKL